MERATLAFRVVFQVPKKVNTEFIFSTDRLVFSTVLERAEKEAP